MDITKELKLKKKELLNYFRSRSSEIQSELSRRYSTTDFKKKASVFNKEITKSKETLLTILAEISRKEKWTNAEILDCVLMITYTNDVVMLEGRNSIWEYEYMAFSRRIGELWEPFCKLCFDYPRTNIEKFIPPLFAEVRKDLTTEIATYIDSLNLQTNEKLKLKDYYNKVWSLVTSGEIQLECDLHFSDETTKYVVDFKSGFGSNEKGNTNRLLLVGSIYNNIAKGNYQCMIFVRSTDNNHYLTTLQDSGVWEISCGTDTYERIRQFSGYDIHGWITCNIDWLNDFSAEMRNMIIDKKLQNYLIW
ncbi:hypothetical protein JHU38_10065 [Prevotella sp. A2931]|uniref:BsaWI restriction endonuclease type 2 domain-containing protein n=1 Tax=Prevotella illustrans TaxID=2800387 RepID=A0ABS3M7I9_9BACT|nr:MULTISPECIES: hypothetical protein [Prevotella]MBO1364109.1 hypothetical protein [Prevotella illustrans]PTL26043.1 hypothetical protein C3V39_02565 [Prevotella sp. oral taxon 820]